MAGIARILALSERVSFRAFSTSSALCGGGHDPSFGPDDMKHIHPRIGKREVLAWGPDGDPSRYYGGPSFPAQGVRFREDTEYVANVLRAKEQGDWKEMTLDEKKELYRTAYQQTIIEYLEQEKYRWKIDLNYNLAIIWMSFVWVAWFQYRTKMEPINAEFEYRQAQFSDAMLADPSHQSQLQHYDPETGEFSKNPWYDVFV